MNSSPTGVGRRDFLGRTAGVTAGAALLSTLPSAPASATPRDDASHPV
ncbi:twin-arginine translocation signal domain-containing protein, partial [Streptomyces sp. Agncl-13]